MDGWWLKWSIVVVLQSSQGGAQSFNLEVVGQYLADEDLKYTEVNK